MSEADKTEWIYSQARTADEDNRQSFLDSLAGNIRIKRMHDLFCIRLFILG